MRNLTGAVARGEDFFNRINEMHALWRDLDTDNLLLLAPRRVGKTSLMRKMEQDSDTNGYTAIYTDVSDCSDELHFVQRLYGAILDTPLGDRLWSKIKESPLGQAIRRVQKIGGAGFSLESAPVTRLGPVWARSWPTLFPSWTAVG
jgi:uncharacterized protein